jgi:NADH dehydrogenase [ubiquinone] 1 alpha subcomplex assembly factor 1
LYLNTFSLLYGLLLMTYPDPPLDVSSAHSSEELVLTDFTSISSDLGWYVVNDNVMGGQSEGDFEQVQGQLNFTGCTNTKGGGFSSIRTKPLQLDLSKQAGIRLSLRGDGRRYTWRLATDARWRGRRVSYWAEFETSKGMWSTVNIPFSSFIPRYRGYQLDGPALDPGQVTGMGLMIYDKQDGPFELQLSSIQVYSADSPFALTQYQWKKRVLVISAPTEDDRNLMEQQHEVALVPEEFADRDMVLVTLLDNAVSKAGDRELTTEETLSARATLGIIPGSFALRLIGKDGSVKLSGEEATSMTEIFALIDTMPMRQNSLRNGVKSVPPPKLHCP